MKVIHLGDIGCRPENWQLDLLKGADAVMAPAAASIRRNPLLYMKS